MMSSRATLQFLIITIMMIMMIIMIVIAVIIIIMIPTTPFPGFPADRHSQTTDAHYSPKSQDFPRPDLTQLSVS